MSHHYYLNEDKTYTPCDLMTWATQFENSDRHVGNDHELGFHISTVWLGLDHSWSETSEPLVFETMVFDERGETKYYCDIYMERYTTWQQAEEGYQKAIQWVRDTYGQKLLESPKDNHGE